MSRVSLEDLNRESSGRNSFFTLKNDKDVARVRFMYNDVEDVQNSALYVHRIKVGDYDRWCECKRGYNDPISKCPLCNDENIQLIRLFIPIYDVDEKVVKVWERTKKYFSKLSSLCARYATNSGLVSHIFEIERNGKAGDKQTTYEFYEVDKDNTKLEDLPELPKVVGTIVLDKSVDELEYYLNEGEFPQETAVKRDESRNSREEYPRRPTGRRTPASNREDRY